MIQVILDMLRGLGWIVSVVVATVGITWLLFHDIWAYYPRLQLSMFGGFGLFVIIIAGTIITFAVLSGSKP